MFPSHNDDSRGSRQYFNQQQQSQQSQQQLQQQQSHHTQQQQQNQQQEQIANLLEYAQSSYNSRPTDALSALMEALTLHNGAGAAQHAMNRIRSELGDVIADAVAGGVGSSTSRSYQCDNGNGYFDDGEHDDMQQSNSNYSGNRHNQQQPMDQHEQEILMTQRAMQIVQELISDTSTILHGQGRQHLLQQAMEDGSSVVCTRCGDMIKRERWSQHCEYWCRALEDEEGKIGEEMMEG